MANDDVVIVSAARTPIGKFGVGKLSGLSAAELGGIAIGAALKRANIPPADVSEVIMGHVLTAGQGQNTAKQAAKIAGLPPSVPAYGINILCGSGLKAVVLGYQAIRCEDAQIVVCGGQECMSQAQHSTYLRGKITMGNVSLNDTMLTDGLTDAFHKVHMGETAEILADKFGISRQEQDEYAFKSQKRAKAAIEVGLFAEEIVPITLPRTGERVLQDEFPQLNCTLEGLGKLKPVFRRTEAGTVTAGNASGVNDAAAALILMSKTEAVKRGLPPLGRIVASTLCSIEPLQMGLAPALAIEKLLLKTGWRKEEVDIYEINEAFAAQAISVLKELGISDENVNTRGGAIALGHPIGASGARILVTLLYALKQTGGKRGIASACIGGGMGIALAVERI